ncbi:MAG: glycosyltransferase [Flammeovirgaceae bacterium]
MSEVSLPLVSCMMPTVWERRHFIPRAIHYFLRQTYANKELLIVDNEDGSLEKIIPTHPAIRYIKIPHRMTLGNKRNFCVEQSKGKLIMHWDDDDWMAPHRISYQVQELLAANAMVCGINNIYYHEPKTGKSWIYKFPPTMKKDWLAGGSLLYTKAFWSAAPFPDIQEASDTPFILSRQLNSFVAHKDCQFYVATMHSNNTSPKRTGDGAWQPIRTNELKTFMGNDWDVFISPTLLHSPIPKPTDVPVAPISNQHITNSKINMDTPEYLTIHKWGDHAASKPKVAILITTYKREKLLAHMLKQLQSEQNDFAITCVVVDDAVLGNGKKGYWKTVNLLWAEAKKIEADYFIQMPDDLELKPNFIKKAVHAWENLKNPKKISLNLLLDSHRLGKTVWTRTFPELHVFDGHRYLKTQWVDMFFICSSRFFRCLDWQVKPIHPNRWAHQPHLSTGVGNQISEHFHHRTDAMYQVTEILVDHVGEESKMNPKIRGTEPLHSVELPKIYAGMATIPNRSHILKATVRSIIQQVDKLFIFFNDFDEIPDWINDYGKIVPYLSKQENTNMGDAGKFYGLNKIDEKDFYFFSLDDDCLYPKNYVWHMIDKIEKYDRKAVVGAGGYIMKPEVKHFYSDRQSSWHIYQNNEKDRIVHILHTCLTAWHSTTLDFNYDSCKLPNMGDIWLGIEAQKQSVPMILVQRPGKWVRIQELPIAKTIYGQYKDKCDEQTQAFNLNPAWQIHELQAT